MLSARWHTHTKYNVTQAPEFGWRMQLAFVMNMLVEEKIIIK